MLNVFRGQRPDITPAMIAGILLAGIPIIANLLRAFGVYDLSEEQQTALGDAVQWGAVSAAAIVGGDAAIRWGRNASDGRTQAAALSASVPPHDRAALSEPITGIVATVTHDIDDEIEWDDRPDEWDEQPDDVLAAEDAVIDDLADEPLPAPVEIKPIGERPETDAGPPA